MMYSRFVFFFVSWVANQNRLDMDSIEASHDAGCRKQIFPCDFGIGGEAEQ